MEVIHSVPCLSDRGSVHLKRLWTASELYPGHSGSERMQTRSCSWFERVVVFVDLLIPAAVIISCILSSIKLV